ncbi:hypothetical protein LCGC14_2408720 [marine sediment metagenome]|uniref:Uncharacterized protein n=1 Tax=marine sediment metagenome TaxID=412755 RepID=A0A0F9BSZ3_9ZZZZ
MVDPTNTDDSENGKKEDPKKDKGGRPRKKPPKVAVQDLSPRPDPFFVHNADENKVYHHAAEDPLRVRQMQQMGYEVVTGDEVLGTPLALVSKAMSGPLNNPGHILMSTSRENRERLDAQKDARLERHAQDVKDKTDAVAALIERAGLAGKKHRNRGELKDDNWTI